MGVLDEAAAGFIPQSRGEAPRAGIAGYDRRLAEAAALNWRRCERDRVDAEDRIRRGGPLAGDDPGRIRKYAERLLTKASAMPSGAQMPDDLREALAEPGSNRETVEAMPRQKLERMIGAAEEFLSVMFIARAAFVLRSVGRIINRRDKNGLGTGFLVAPNVLMTNEHVLDTAARAGAALVQFQYELDIGLRELGGHLFRLDPDRLFLADRELDFALVAVADLSEDKDPAKRVELAKFGYLPLAGIEGKIHVGQPVNIIQHPGGGRKQIVFRESTLKLLPKGKDLDNVAHYTGDTKPGSSGSPVFSDAWEVIALHHSGVPDTDERGWLDVNGNPWDRDTDPKMERVKWVANEGIRVSRLVKRIEQHHATATGPARELIRSVLEVGRRAAEEDPFASDAEIARRVPVTSGTAANESAPPAPPDMPTGSVSFQIPLNVTVSLGRPTRG
jgi:Trypsin-like peptidase domain